MLLLLLLPSAAVAAPPPECERDADFSDWPGGRALRLDVPAETFALIPGEATTLTVTGAAPGERIEIFVGAECGLDCPADLDGACFQPGGSERVAELTADAAGSAEAAVTLDAAWADQWVVLQATAPDRAERALSEAVVLVNGSADPLGESDQWREISPLVILGLSVGNLEYWWWPVAAGRRTQVVNTQEPDETYCHVVVQSTEEDVDCWHVTGDVWYASPYTFQFTTYDGKWVIGGYNLDIRTVPLDAPIDWYPDADRDGYGDPLGVAVSSATPVAAASPDARDCDDLDPLVHPIGPEICGDGVDQDCDGEDRSCREAPGVSWAPEVGTRLAGLQHSGWGEVLTTGDLDGDGITDVLGGGWSFQMQAFSLTRRDTDTPFATYAGWSYTPLAAGDHTGDGVDDLVLPIERGVAIFAGPLIGDLEAEEPVATLIGASLGTPAGVGDVTGDAIADVFAFEDGRMRVYDGPSTGDRTESSAEIPTRDGGRDPLGTAAGDADGDGLGDLWTSEVCLHLSPLPIADSEPIGCVDGGSSSQHAHGGMVPFDVDLDGHGDLVIGEYSGVRVLLGPLAGDVGFDDGTWLLVDTDDANYYRIGVTPDRDEDGFPELLLTGPGAVWSVSATGPGTLVGTAGTRLYTGTTDQVEDENNPGLLGGDFDGDGLGDVLITRSDAAYDARSFAGTGTVLWGAGATYVPPGDPEDPEDPADAGDLPPGPADSAAHAGEPAGCGCGTADLPGTSIAALLGAVLARRRVRSAARRTSR
jgi:hypothetical protein